VPSIRVKKDHVAICVRLFAAAVLAVIAAVSIHEAHTSAQDLPSVIGRIEGDDVEVATTTPAGVEKDPAPTVVANGSDVTLRSGHALVMLNAGGEISVCGPAHFKMIQASGSLTLALDYGRVHPSLESSEGVTIYTPTVVATPVAIAGGMRDTTVGLDPAGEMCVLTSRGAMRVEPQFSAQSMIVPQGGSVSLSGGEVSSLQADASACSCDYPRTHLNAPAAESPAESASAQTGEPRAEIGYLASPTAPPRRKPGNVPPPAASGKGPIYTVLMPALSFSMNSPGPPPAPAPEPAPETITLVREVQLRPLYEFRGRVNPAPQTVPAPQNAVPAAPGPSGAQSRAASSSSRPEKQIPTPKPNLVDRMRNFFRRLTTRNDRDSPCAGYGCSG
jgi:hypothetical protein